MSSTFIIAVLNGTCFFRAPGNDFVLFAGTNHYNNIHDFFIQLRTLKKFLERLAVVQNKKFRRKICFKKVPNFFSVIFCFAPLRTDAQNPRFAKTYIQSLAAS